MRRGIISSVVSGATFAANTSLLTGTQYYTAGDILDVGAASFSFTGNFMVATGAPDRGTILTRYTGTTDANNCFIFRYRTAGEVVDWVVQGGSTIGKVAVPISLDTFYSFYIEYNSVAQTISFSLDDATPVTIAHTAGVNSGGTADFEVGNRTGTDALAGSIAAITAYSRLLTSGEQTLVHNGGSPLCYDSRTPAINAATTNSWNLANSTDGGMPIGDELIDQKGVSNLTAIGSPTYTDQGLTVECS